MGVSNSGNLPASILYKSIAGRYRPFSYPDGPITASYRFIKNAYWADIVVCQYFLCLFFFFFFFFFLCVCVFCFVLFLYHVFFFGVSEKLCFVAFLELLHLYS